MKNRGLAVVKLLDPGMCLDCRFAKKAIIETSEGSMVRMTYCRRGDCDNWDFNSAEPARLVRVDDGESSDPN